MGLFTHTPVIIIINVNYEEDCFAFVDILSFLVGTALLWALTGDLWLELSTDAVLFRIRSVSDGFFCLPSVLPF